MGEPNVAFPAISRALEARKNSIVGGGAAGEVNDESLCPAAENLCVRIERDLLPQLEEVGERCKVERMRFRISCRNATRY